MIFHQRDVELPKGIHCVDSIVSLKLGIKNNFRVPVRKNFHKEELNHWTSRICIVNCNFRRNNRNSIDRKEHQQTATINNECLQTNNHCVQGTYETYTYYLDTKHNRQLGGNQFFSFLDQNKAYHQLHNAPAGRKCTAFITPLIK